MIVKVIKDATLTIKAGQTVDIDERQAAIAIKMGFAEVEKEKKKRAAK